MSRTKGGSTARDDPHNKATKRNKENSVSDTVFLIQNENDVLRMKNTQLNNKIKELKLQLQMYTDSIVLCEKDIENVRNQISGSEYKEDLKIEAEKKQLIDKLMILKTNEQILLRKIHEAREATIFEEEKVAAIQHDRKGIEVDILSLRAQNEGTKIVLQNLEEQNEKLRAENEKLISKRKVFEPKEQQISIEIEQRIRYIKNQQQLLRTLKKSQTVKLIFSALSLIQQNKLRSHFSRVNRYSLLRKYAHKKIVQVSLIRKKYTTYIKNYIMGQLRSTFRPLEEQETAKRIIAQTHKRRIKAFIWRKWRTQTKNAQFNTTRKFQFQNTLQKISQSLTKSNIFSSFNLLKYFQNNAFHQKSTLVIDGIWRNFTNRCKVQFFSALRQAEHKYTIDKEIESSSKDQSQLMVMSLYFSAWAKRTKAENINNLSIKRRYFKELRKLPAIKRRRLLGQALNKINSKINKKDIISQKFFELKKQTATSKIQGLEQQQAIIQQKIEDIRQQVQEMHSDKKTLYQQLALIKISKYLKTKVQKAFDIWRLRKQQSKVLLTIINMVESKKSFDKNFGFAKILKKRFAMLKKSINDKIASCEFSYNYLLDQNKHIKEVLDNKTHDLEKTKFMNILKKICRTEKQMKLKYFYKFMRSGYKFWRFRKVCQRVDKIAETKIKMVFMWLLKKDLEDEKQTNRIQTFLEEKQRQINQRLCRKGFVGLLKTKENNSRLKRVLGGIFYRNMELDFYVAFGKIRNEEHLYYRGLIKADTDELQDQINTVKEETQSQEKQIQVLKDRLSYKEDTLAQRKILGLYTFFVRNIKTKYCSIIKRWRDRVKRQNRVLQFATILERKSRSLLKSKFMLYINQKNEDFSMAQLQNKHKKFQTQYDTMVKNQEKFLADKEKEILQRKDKYQTFKNDGQLLEKHTDHMVSLKLKSFKKTCNKKKLKYLFEAWREQTYIFADIWSNVNNTLSMVLLRQSFQQFATVMKEQLFKQRIRNNLLNIYNKTYRYNAGVGFRVWRYVLLDKRIILWTEQERRQMTKFQGLQKKYKYAISRHNGQVIYRQYDPKLRALWNIWRQYTQHKIYNNNNKKQLQSWLFRGYCSQLIFLLKKKVTNKIQIKNKIRNLQRKWQQKRMRTFIYEACDLKNKKNTLQRLFIHKYCPFMMHKTVENIFSKIKNYGHNQQVLKKTDKTMRIQHVIELFEKRRKFILSTNMVKWRRNQFQMNIARNLLRKITRNAMNWRVKDCFFSWKLETEAKAIKQMHEQEGQVKKRKIEIGRLKTFLEDFKRQKGLLLEDDGGKLVLSPRFEEKKNQQIKKDNNLRYKFISRLILSMNGYSAPVKAWNNLKVYMQVRQKYRKCALFTKNNLKKPDLYYAFKTWHKASVEFTKMFDTMERKGLIKILNRQKDKMEMEYSKKVNLEEKIQDEMRMHKVLSYHEDRKQKLAALLLLKNIRKIKHYGMQCWRDRVREFKEGQLYNLQDQGNTKISDLEEQVNELQEEQRELRQNNEKLEQAVQEALDIAEMVKRITEERDMISRAILQKEFTCQSLQEQNQELNAKLYQAQKQAMNLLILSGEKL